MARDSILHMFTRAPNLSPFDVNMAVDAGWQHCIPYTGLETDDIADLTQDAIFSRGPKGVRRTGIFIGGRDIHVAMDMLALARQAMVPPFEVSVFADPSGAFTTGAGMVACVEKQFREAAGEGLEGRTALVFGGTGPVGMTCAMLAERAGANAVIISHQGLDVAQAAASACNERYGSNVDAADGSDDAKVRALLADADMVFSAAKAGVQVLTKSHLAAAQQVRVFCDVNAVPPEGIAGVGVMDNGKPVEGASNAAVGIGALAVGNVKYQTQQTLLQQMLDSDGPVYLDFYQAFDVARGKA
jgi:methylene-tetrahydromethanopterin dehydrogenase